MCTRWNAVAHAFGLIALTLSLSSCCGQFFKGPQDLTGISVSPDGNTIQLGNTQQFSAMGTFQYNNGPTGDVSGRTEWSSSDSTIATVDANGLATGVAYGTVTIKGTCDCYSHKVVLTVGTQDVSLSSIAVTPSAKSIAVAKTQQFTATGTYSNNSTKDLTSSVTWTSSDTTVATIDSRGLATAVAAGTATIKASSGSISGNTTLTVTTSSGG